jgi:ABC-type bacteriocin/lantibiotic exporter with double-glycine peptidase domain
VSNALKPIDVEQAYREYVPPGGLSDRDVLLRAAKQEGFKARHIAVRFDRLATLPLPAIAEGHDGAFFILARVDPDGGVLVQEIGRPKPRPQASSAHSFTLWCVICRGGSRQHATRCGPSSRSRRPAER